MSVHIFNTQEVQDFLRLASGLNQEGGNPRAKQIIHRILSDLYKAIEDLDITSDEYWAGVAYLNQLGARGDPERVGERGSLALVAGAAVGEGPAGGRKRCMHRR